MDIDRRTLLAGAGALVVTPALPLAAEASAPALHPAWAVGTYGRHNWRVFHAATEEAARQMWVNFNGLYDYPKEVPELSVASAEWLPHREEGVEPDLAADDYKSLDWDYACDRCGETVGEYEVVHADGICHDCMTEEDWRVADPEYWADHFGPEPTLPASAPADAVTGQGET